MKNIIFNLIFKTNYKGENTNEMQYYVTWIPTQEALVTLTHEFFKKIQNFQNSELKLVHVRFLN